MPATAETMTSTLDSADSTDAFELVLTSTEPRADTRLLAVKLGIQHLSLFKQVKSYKADFEAFGKVRFQIEPLSSGQAEKFALLNEDQAHLLLTYSRNTVKVRALKVKLVKAFSSARRASEVRQLEYLPGYHLMHDAIKVAANGSPNERWHHVNANKALNKVAGLQPGQRTVAGPGVLSMLTVGACLAAQAALEPNGTQALQDRIKAALAPLQDVPALLAAGRKP